MRFTPQRYSSKTRVGNWFEELCLEDAKRADACHEDYEKYETKINHCTKAVQHVPNLNGTINYGQNISLAHQGTKGTLSSDPFELTASVCKSLLPIARNTFIFLPTEESEHGERKSDCIRWGVPFRIVCCPEILNSNSNSNIDEKDTNNSRQLFLSSSLKTEHRVSPISCEQLVALTEKNKFDTHWIAQLPARTKGSGFTRFMSVGAPILAGENLVIQHCATKNLLYCDTKFQMNTDFGREFEVSACTKFVTGRVNILQEEFQGVKTKNTICRPQQDQNVWSVVFLSSNEETKNN